MREASWFYEDLEYLFTIIIQSFNLLSNITEPILLKLFPSERMDVKLGRSTLYPIEPYHSYYALSIHTIHLLLFHEVLTIQDE